MQWSPFSNLNRFAQLWRNYPTGTGLWIDRLLWTTVDGGQHLPVAGRVHVMAHSMANLPYA
jgi:uncharacterized protein YbaP (TraB family)